MEIRIHLSIHLSTGGGRLGGQTAGSPPTCQAAAAPPIARGVAPRCKRLPPDCLAGRRLGCRRGSRAELAGLSHWRRKESRRLPAHPVRFRVPLDVEKNNRPPRALRRQQWAAVIITKAAEQPPRWFTERMGSGGGASSGSRWLVVARSCSWRFCMQPLASSSPEDPPLTCSRRPAAKPPARIDCSAPTARPFQWNQRRLSNGAIDFRGNSTEGREQRSSAGVA